MAKRQKYKQPMVNTEQLHYDAFKWCCDNHIKVYPKPRGGQFILVYSIDGVANTSNKLHEKKNYQQAIWDFYLFLYNKFKDVRN